MWKKAHVEGIGRAMLVGRYEILGRRRVWTGRLGRWGMAGRERHESLPSVALASSLFYRSLGRRAPHFCQQETPKTRKNDFNKGKIFNR